ncbi:MAG TPA: DUF397 domain-containing protein [Pseudonocardiaceae bacterium]|jgi:hypothetical protein|nr:DUF397 domain-containing protein [Pseudonocardiaceae bacterium]
MPGTTPLDCAHLSFRKSSYSAENGAQCVEVAFRKSSYSTEQGGNCVEVAFRKSSYSSENGQACVEVARHEEWAAVRDSKLGPASPLLTTPGANWTAFLTALKRDRLTRPE